MIIKKNEDGSQSEYYQNGDFVEITGPSNNPELGEWGEVYLTDLRDRKNGHASDISTIIVELAGFSLHEDSFLMRRQISSFHVKAIPEQMKQAIEDAKKHDNCNGMTPSVYRVMKDGKYHYGFNFQPLTAKRHDRFHYDYGAGINRNTDAEIIWMKNKLQ